MKVCSICGEPSSVAIPWDDCPHLCGACAKALLSPTEWSQWLSAAAHRLTIEARRGRAAERHLVTWR